MAHELIHATHSLDGVSNRTKGDYIGLDGKVHNAKKEEQATVGVGHSYTPTTSFYPTENSIRREQGLNERAYY